MRLIVSRNTGCIRYTPNVNADIFFVIFVVIIGREHDFSISIALIDIGITVALRNE